MSSAGLVIPVAFMAGDDQRHIAALGVAGAWRLGKWNLLKRYLEMANSNSAMKQAIRQPWDVSIGQLLSAVHDRFETSFERPL